MPRLRSVRVDGLGIFDADIEFAEPKVLARHGDIYEVHTPGGQGVEKHWPHGEGAVRGAIAAPTGTAFGEHEVRRDYLRSVAAAGAGRFRRRADTDFRAERLWQLDLIIDAIEEHLVARRSRRRPGCPNWGDRSPAAGEMPG